MSLCTFRHMCQVRTQKSPSYDLPREFLFFPYPQNIAFLLYKVVDGVFGGSQINEVFLLIFVFKTSE